MSYTNIPFEKRIKDNIKNYSIQNLFPQQILKDYISSLAGACGMEILLTDRHGIKEVSTGNFADFEPDVVREPGRKLRIQERTVGHVYTRPAACGEAQKELLEQSVRMLEALGEEMYLHSEYSAYLDELEAQSEAGGRTPHGERGDALTGVLNKVYFGNRLQVIDRTEIAPVAVLNANINDWKFVNDNYGDEESNRLIQVIASILQEEAKPDYIIGRTDGDVFNVVIPIPENGEVEDYCARVEKRCSVFEDVRLAPSVAIGAVYKTNVEEKLSDKLSDAEYEMFQRKLDMKRAPGYQERLRKGMPQ